MGYPRTEPLFGATLVSNVIVEPNSATMMGAMVRNNCCDWEALPLRSSLGSPARKPWEKTQETRPLSLAGPAPFVGRRGDELSPAGVWRRKPLHLGVSVRTR